MIRVIVLQVSYHTVLVRYAKEAARRDDYRRLLRGVELPSLSNAWKKRAHGQPSATILTRVPCLLPEPSAGSAFRTIRNDESLSTNAAAPAIDDGCNAPPTKRRRRRAEASELVTHAACCVHGVSHVPHAYLCPQGERKHRQLEWHFAPGLSKLGPCRSERCTDG